MKTPTKKKSFTMESTAALLSKESRNQELKHAEENGANLTHNPGSEPESENISSVRHQETTDAGKNKVH